MSTAFGSAEFADRVQRIQEAMLPARLDAVLLTEQSNFQYVTGYVVNVLWSSYTRVLAVIVPATGSPTLVTPDFVAAEAGDVTGWPIVTYSSLARPPIPELLRVLREMGVARGRIGLERGGESRIGMTVEVFDALGTALSGAELVDAGVLMHGVRLRKSPAEIDRLRWACAANQAGMRAAFGRPRLGDLEVDIGREIFRAGLEASAGWPAWTVPGWIGMTSGPGSYHRFVEQPRRLRLERGDLLWTDVGFRVDGYWSDYCRGAVVGGPTARQADRQMRIVEATSAGVSEARPGRRASDVARAVGVALERLGLPGLGFGRVGHGIGLSATEPPSIALHDDTMLEAGMVVTVEPAAVFDDGIYCTEQIVVVGDPPEVLSLAPLELATI